MSRHSEAICPVGHRLATLIGLSGLLQDQHIRGDLGPEYSARCSGKIHQQEADEQSLVELPFRIFPCVDTAMSRIVSIEPHPIVPLCFMVVISLSKHSVFPPFLFEVGGEVWPWGLALVTMSTLMGDIPV
jgi:hypothetical protein